MEEIIVGNVEELCDKVKGKMVYIYGAKLNCPLCQGHFELV